MPEIRYGMKTLEIAEMASFAETYSTGRCDRPSCPSSVIIVFRLGGWATQGLLYDYDAIALANETSGGQVVSDADIKLRVERINSGLQQEHFAIRD